jgi:type IV secretion system protein VirB10
MTGDPANPAGDSGGKVPAETLELRARPQPVTRINRRVLIGAAAIVLFFVSALVLVALKPPSLRLGQSPELFNVEHKPITDGLSKLPASYDGVRPTAVETARLPPGVPKLSPGLNAAIDAAGLERARLARMAGQAHESEVFFRLQGKVVGAETARTRPDPSARSLPRSSDPALETAAAKAAAARARALAGGDLDLATEGSEATRKLSFLTAEPEEAIYNRHALQQPASPYQLMAGTIIAASLISGLNSDLPGFVIAQVTEPVYDSVSGRHLLIPQGTRLLGRYDNVVAFGQQRALVIWQRIILPDGSSVVIDNLPATDSGGYAGLADQIDFHTWQLLKGVALATLLGVGSELAFGAADNNDLVKALQQATQSTSNRAGQRLVERNLNVQPTLKVRPGWPLRVIVHKDIILRPIPER